MVPLVELCYQQHGVITRMVPAATTKIIVGTDGPERWSSQSIWNEALAGVHVVISTYAVLRDALTHGFVRMKSISLLIFDEGTLINFQLLDPSENLAS
jgi:ERCC4-related helicase